ncbi:DNA topoisomerase (ATP-hydrolyzing) subunit B [Treponema vincentii]|uniref:DNA gyrase subunit B n=2 Tax=Treponema vincentii TaxID=69710 RepID=S3LDW5_9SPIR|nr:DNA topoisomerase (ATP-hydrolyzing) subunit B [Treponema vincentii]EEV19700.1 DNA gyrase, B subunit [Treponema vincentii ATCC 35580]EPF47985.1 DNA gyrase subunit B [Treponema vincentii F0403]UTC46098.1 DNA topoisomerase (ATP-hydrolyzing) subunit B [Treponema vincentii]UTC48735.1 DNA topoisomerase (ATP-hydrolyzing) subunit B [Treponema vincentii]UTC61068.1 DNA topoisomerase (ATP-hydrolyzing) subunit B [Treponema vincentii]
MTTPSYSAENITVLKGLDAVRKRPGMYIGSTGPDGLHHLVYEVVDNCIDEAMAGYCDTILVVLEKNDTVRVEDNGRGIPVDIHPEEGVSALELVLTRLHAGGKFDKGSYKVSGGLHGVGVSVVNALSTSMEAIVCRDGFEYVQKFALGEPLGPVTKRGETQKRGTTIRWTADPSIFTETTTYNFDVLAVRLRELAFLNNTIKITLRDERLSTPKEVTFAFDGGLSHFVRYLNESKQVLPKEPIYFEGEKNDVVVEIAMQYNDGYKENILSFVNDINTREGGTHLEGFKTALTRVMNEFLKKNAKLSKKMEKEEKLMGEDVRAGLTAVLSVKVPEPQFEGQTKTKLGNSEVRSIVDTFINEKLTLFFEQNPIEIDKILEKAVGEATARIAARKAKEATRRKSGLDSFGLPGKLADCSSKDPEKCEVYIVEGDSAGGSAKKGRDSKTQAILPLWGKMLNVEKTRLDKVLNNEKLQPIIATLGTGIGEDFNLDKIRYHKIIIMADADVDGSHIRTLLLTFFFRYMPELIEHGFVYLAMPPLYKISYNKKEWYVYDDSERDSILNEIGRSVSPAVQRYKGLGEMDGTQLWETTMDPARRKMMRVTLSDAVEADRIFSTLMGEEVEPRRKFIEENAVYANLDV